MTSKLAAPAGLLLPIRTGLPREIAYLREAHPEPQWRGHVNYGELAAFWLQIHDGLRHHGQELATGAEAFREGRFDADGFQRFFVPRYNQFLQHLNGHHQIEDRAYFPRFRALDPRMVSGFDLLENDHEIIHDKLIASTEAAQKMLLALSQDGDARQAVDGYATAFEELLELLVRHLADEEELVIPAMLEHGERSIS